ncbi:hypothetical protein [Desulfoscipio gibsoniae]|uniref:hypothetical protein n=1 Tax=Desulfoscipio gibsoniae TaxID=102134 RepID=UPI0012FEFAA0|nr:hypothetical protein [Desulfoscipio gibsoniae]
MIRRLFRCDRATWTDAIDGKYGERGSGGAGGLTVPSARAESRKRKQPGDLRGIFRLFFVYFGVRRLLSNNLITKGLTPGVL